MAGAISVKFKNLDGLSRTLKSKASKSSEVDKVLGKGAFRVERDAKLTVRVDKGVLRSSLHTTKIKKLKWKVSDGVSYGKFIEFGTRFFVGTHFLQNSARKNSKRLAIDIAKVY